MESLKEKGGRFLKTIVLNGREVAQLTETLKQKVQAGAQRIRRYEKRETQCSQNKTFKESTTNFPETLA